MTAFQLFKKHAIQLDDLFDDGLIITYKNSENSLPCYEIIVDESIDIADVRAQIPQDWKNLESQNLITIDLRRLTKEEIDQSHKTTNELREDFVKTLITLSTTKK